MAKLGRPATGQTPVRNVRVPDEIWDAALEEAAAEGVSVASWINADLEKRIKAARRRREREQGAG